jgi:NAD(P)-dependent dehydrogenase (short-subunit alcohol dehydrogenase family)
VGFRGLNEKVIVVTGAAQGIGAAYAERLIEEGSTVVLADRNEDGAQAVVDRSSGPGVGHAFGLDVSDPGAGAALASFVGERFGRLDGLVNNAAIFSTIQMRPFWEISVAEWDALMAVNVRGPWLLTSALLPLLRKSRAASVVNIGSDSVAMGRQGYLHYTTSKAGIQGMTFGMSHELGNFGIRVNTLSPGAVRTEVPRATVTPQQQQAIIDAQALHRVGVPEDMTSLAAFLLSDDSGYITGQTISVNGGNLHR